jgi:hypothetical protein
MMSSGDWLSTTRNHQAEVHGVDHLELACNADKLTEYVSRKLNVAAQAVEHARVAVPQESWSEEAQRKLWEEDRGIFVDDMVHALACLGAILTAVGCTEKEMAERIAQLHNDEMEAATDPLAEADTESVTEAESEPETGPKADSEVEAEAPTVTQE